MERRTLVLLLVIVTAVACGAAWLVLNPPGRRGVDAADGGPTHHALPPFRFIAVEGRVDVALVEGTTEGATVNLPTRGASKVTLEVEGDTLNIRGGEPRRWWQIFGSSAGRQPRITVVFRQLDGIRLAGAVKLHAASIRTAALSVSANGAAALKIEHLDTGSLQLAGAGAIKADVAGRAKEQKIALAGAGLFRGGELAGERVHVSVSGAGKASVRASETLDVAISGAGSVDYTGNPRITQEIHGAGKIRRRGAEDGGPVRTRMAAAPRSRPAASADGGQCRRSSAPGGMVSGLYSSGCVVPATRSG